MPYTHSLSDALTNTPPSHTHTHTHTHTDPATAAAAENEGAAGEADLVADASGGGGLQMSQRLLTKYIMYARSNVRPQIQDVDQDKIERLYVDLRRESKQCGGVRACVGWLVWCAYRDTEGEYRVG